MTRLTLDLHVTERDALFKMAQCERRKPRDQAALIIRQALEQTGYLPTDPMLTQAQPAHAREVSSVDAS